MGVEVTRGCFFNPLPEDMKTSQEFPNDNLYLGPVSNPDSLEYEGVYYSEKLHRFTLPYLSAPTYSFQMRYLGPCCLRFRRWSHTPCQHLKTDSTWTINHFGNSKSVILNSEGRAIASKILSLCAICKQVVGLKCSLLYSRKKYSLLPTGCENRLMPQTEWTLQRR